jgi:excisionase family DNA binding protein
MKDQIESTDAERRGLRRRATDLPPEENEADRIEGEEDDPEEDEEEEEEEDEDEDDDEAQGGDDEEEEEEEDEDDEEAILAQMRRISISIDDLPSVLTVKEVALFLRVKPKSIYKLVANCVIPCRKVGRRLRFDRDALLAWLREKIDPKNPRRRLS